MSISLEGINVYNVSEFVENTDFESLSLKELAETWALLRNMCESHKRNMLFKAEVRGRFVFTSDVDGSFRFSSGSTKEQIISEIRRKPSSILSNRQALVRSALNAATNEIKRINFIAEAISVAMDRIELRILKGELSA